MALDNNQGFYYHTVDGETAAVMTDIRKRYLELAMFLEQSLPPNTRYRALCLTDLEASSMRAIQALAVARGVKIDPFAPAPEIP